jgi:predicted lipoprotein with Yx(FWY)xxD motif
MSPNIPRPKRLLIAVAAVATSLTLAACGGGSSDPSTAARNGETVTVKSIDGIGDVLVDSSGKALYAADVEADGKVHCTDGCTSFWTPVTLDSGMPTAADQVAKLGVIKRPDGTRQVTANRKLLYTFSEDSPGSVEGNGFSDEFDGEHFTWHAVLAGGKLAGASDNGAGY